MPSLNEIAEFRNDLKRIAHEEQVTAGWKGKVYDELPPPDQGDIPDLDDVLTSLNASQGEVQQMPQNNLSSLNTENTGGSAAVPQGATEKPLARNDEGADAAFSFEDDPTLNFDDILSSLSLDSEPAESAGEKGLSTSSDADSESNFPASLDDADDRGTASGELPDLMQGDA
ncbi:MAG: periplasmic-type flagellar collar protein FlcA, partial [Treponema sp.]